MYVMFVMVATGGLMAVAQLAPIAKDYKVATVPVSLIGITLPALTFALTIDRIMNGLTRPFFGWVSDHLGRENTMFGAFLIEGAGILLLLKFAADPVAFVILTGLVFFAWGEILQPVPGDHCGHLRSQVLHHHLRDAVHGQGDGLVAGAHRKHHRPAVGLVDRVHRLGRSQLRGGSARPAGAQTSSSAKMSDELIPDALGISRV